MSAEFKKLAIEAKKLSEQSFAFIINFANELQMEPEEYRDFFRIIAAHQLGASIDLYLDTEGLDARDTLLRLLDLRIATKKQRNSQKNLNDLH